MQMMTGAVVAGQATAQRVAIARACLAEITALQTERAAQARVQTMCQHQWEPFGRKVGRCLHEYACKTCGAVRVVDSSD